MNIAVIHYSLTGHSTQIAQAIAAELDTTVYRIEDTRPRRGASGVLRSVVQTLLGLKVRLNVPEIDLEACDLVIAGGPIWVGQICAPLKTWLKTLRRTDTPFAYFIVHRDTYSENVLNQLKRLTGKQPIAIADFIESDVEAGRIDDKIRQFCNAISKSDLPLEQTDSKLVGAD